MLMFQIKRAKFHRWVYPLDIWMWVSKLCCCYSNSLLDLHNESGACILLIVAPMSIVCLVIVNIHSHLWGAVLFVFFLFTIYGRLMIYPSASFYDTVNISIFLVAAVICLSFSASYHTMTCHSQTVRLPHIWHSMTETEIWTDAWLVSYPWLCRNCRCVLIWIIGIISILMWVIVVLIVGSFFPCVYYTFYCDLHLQVIYLFGITISGIGRYFCSRKILFHQWDFTRRIIHCTLAKILSSNIS